MRCIICENIIALRKFWKRIIGTDKPPVVGDGTDEHGCCGAAGYVWCEVKKQCVRTWEEPCKSCKEISCPLHRGYGC
jgi:hypothetical protein